MEEDKRISELEQVTKVTGEELIPIVIDGENKSVKSKYLKDTNNLDEYATKEELNEIKENMNELDIENLTTELNEIKENNIKYSTMRNNANNQGVQLNGEGLANKDIIYTDANTTSYAILLNYGTKNGKNLRISDNLVHSENADAIELNNPSDLTDGKDVFKNVLVTNNFVSTGTASTAMTAGFAIGIAQTHNVVVANNVVDCSRNEGLHIEDATKNITVVGNVFDGNINDGCRLIYKSRNTSEFTKASTIIGNHFSKKTDLEGTGRGIYRVYDTNGSVIADLSHNRIEGFDTGIYLDGDRTVIADGCIIERCNIGLSVAGTVMGSMVMQDTPTLVQFRSNAHIESIYATSPVDVEKMFVFPSDPSATIITLNKLDYTLPKVTGISGTVTTNMKMLPQPTYMEGILKVRIPGSFYTNRIYHIKIENDENGTPVITSKLLKTKTYGSLSLSAFTITDGYLNLNVYTSGLTTFSSPQIHFEGTIIY